VSAVAPSMVNSGNTSLVLTGSLFGTTSSDVLVSVAFVTCSVTSVIDSTIYCDIGHVSVGSHDVIVVVAGVGKAVVTGVKIMSEAVIRSVSPAEGSAHGGTLLTILGSGFVYGTTTVIIDGHVCVIQTVTLSEVKCLTPAHADGNATIVVTSSAILYPGQYFVYSTYVTATVTSIAPSAGLPGETLTITGDNFSMLDADNVVWVGGSDCLVTSSQVAEIQCNLGAEVTGSHRVQVLVQGAGLSNDDVMFEYQLSVASIEPASGK
jgi:hypothetical protein